MCARRHNALLRLPWLIPLLARLATPVRKLPASWRARVLRSQVGQMEPQYVRLVEEGMLHRGAIQNYLYLARTEMLALAAPFAMPGSLRPLVDAGRVRALYIESGDEWAPLTVEKRLREMGVRTTVVRKGEASHAFSCSASDTRVVSEWVERAVRG